MKNLFRSFYLFITDILETVVLAFALFIVVNVFIAQLHEVYGNSMLPDFKNGEYLLTDKITYRLRLPQRGEIIIFKAPEPPHRDYIKRIIGLPGESLLLKDGLVFIFNPAHPQGFKLKEKYLQPGTPTEGKSAIPDNTRYFIPVGTYVVFGDNRAVSSDSRSWGTVAREEIIGRSLIKLWPLNSLSFIAHARYGE